MFKDIEDPTKKDQKLSVSEKLVVAASVALGKLVLNKARKCTTYGQLTDILEVIEATDTEASAEFPDARKTEEGMMSVISSISKAVKDL